MHTVDVSLARLVPAELMPRLPEVVGHMTYDEFIDRMMDNLFFADGVEPLTRALEPFLGLPGAFVMGDHDYYATVFRLPTRYLRTDPRTADAPDAKEALPVLPWREVRDLQASGGWANLGNRRDQLVMNNSNYAITA